jgi:membrane protease YdiL (CAAX protease family)
VAKLCKAAARDRRRALMGIAFVVGCVLVAEWAVLPLFGRDFRVGALPVVAAFVFMFLSHRAHGESARELGWRVDNLAAACRRLAGPMLLGAALLALVGWLTGGGSAGRYRLGWPLLTTFAALFVWGLMQQYALQGFINRRAQAVWGRGPRSVLFVAAVFGLLHLPNLWLTAATFAGGLMWAWVYQRAPNLLALVLALAFAAFEAPADSGERSAPFAGSEQHCVAGAVVDEEGNITPTECAEPPSLNPSAAASPLVGEAGKGAKSARRLAATYETDAREVWPR